MHPIYLMLGLVLSLWLMMWGADEIEGDNAPFAFLLFLFGVLLGISVVSTYVGSLP